MLAIWKYEVVLNHVDNNNHYKVMLPRGAQLLSAVGQYGKLMVYAIINTYEPQEFECTISVIGTGHNIKSIPGRFLGTVVLDDGNSVFHVFH
jgi:hypothetical protein